MHFVTSTTIFSSGNFLAIYLLPTRNMTEICRMCDQVYSFNAKYFTQ